MHPPPGERQVWKCNLNGISTESSQPDRFKSLLSKHQLKVIVMVFTDGPVAPGEGLVFGGPYQGFSPPSQPGETDKNLLVENHIRVFKEQVGHLIMRAFLLFWTAGGGSPGVLPDPGELPRSEGLLHCGDG